MARYEAGLHKDVSVIFDGVWIPEIDNFQQSVAAPAPVAAAYVHPSPLAADKWSFPQAVWSKKPRFAAVANIVKQVPGHIFSSRAKREEKRLLEISKHLLINLPS